MKLQVGLLYRDDRRALPCDLEMLLGACNGLTAEISGAVSDGSLLMAYRGDRIAWEEESETQPFQFGPYYVTFDGRLDNREELASCIGIGKHPGLSDVEIIAQAYERTGEWSLHHLIGEFALTLWSRLERTLIFLRSECGARPLYYISTKDYLLWSSDFRHLTITVKTGLAINDKYILDYLTSLPRPTDTPFQNIHAIAPGDIVRFSNGMFQPSVPSWNPHSVAELRLHSDDEYQDRLRHLMRDAVKARLRAKGPVFAELSGGLDSSSVVLLADDILCQKQASASELHTVSCVYEESRDTADERYFINLIENVRGAKSLYVHENDQQITLGLESRNFTGLPNPMHCFPGRYPAFAAQMKKCDARVLLTGLGGDNLFWADAEPVPLIADHLWKWQLATAHRECQIWSRCTGTPYWQILFNALALTIGGLVAHPPQYAKPRIPAWLSSQHREQAHSRLSEKDRSREPGQRAKLHFLEILFGLLRTGYVSEYSEIYISHPWTYRPLVEFCLSVPVSQLLRTGETRSLMRRTMKDLLPQKILTRRGKGLVSEPFARAIQKEWSRVNTLEEWEVCRRKYANPQRILTTIERIQLGFVTDAGDLIRLFSLERWLRSLSHIPQQTTVG